MKNVLPVQREEKRSGLWLAFWFDGSDLSCDVIPEDAASVHQKPLAAFTIATNGQALSSVEDCQRWLDASEVRYQGLCDRAFREAAESLSKAV